MYIKIRPRSETSKERTFRITVKAMTSCTDFHVMFGFAMNYIWQNLGWLVFFEIPSEWFWDTHLFFSFIQFSKLRGQFWRAPAEHTMPSTRPETFTDKFRFYRCFQQMQCQPLATALISLFILMNILVLSELFAVPTFALLAIFSRSGIISGCASGMASLGPNPRWRSALLDKYEPRRA